MRIQLAVAENNSLHQHTTCEHQPHKTCCKLQFKADLVVASLQALSGKKQAANGRSPV